MTTQITAAGVTSATRAQRNQGPKINITTFKIGPTIIVPAANDPATDITDAVYTGVPSQLQYAVVDDHTVEYIVTLDESVGNPPFNVGRIGLYMDNGDGTNTLFSITAIDAPNPDYKFATTGNVVGNRITYSIYLAISNMATIANFTIQLLQLLSIPEVATELILPDPLHVAFNTYQVMKHSVARIPAVAYRETATQGRTNPAWLMASERLIPGQGEGVIPADPAVFDGLATVGSVVGLGSAGYIIGEPATNLYIEGVRSGPEEITNYGVYVDPVNTYSPWQKLYVGTGNTAGTITTIANQWPIGFAIGPVTTQNATGYECWIDFTSFFRAGQPGPAGPVGPAGPAGSAGSAGAGGGGGFSNPGQCYLMKVGSNLVLIPYNGNSIIINSVIQKIPVGGVALPPTGLLANQLYYIYAMMNGSTMALMASTANHITSTYDGVEIMNTDQTKTLVGMAYTIVGPAWSDTDGQLYVLSWFNRKEKRSRTVIPNVITSRANEWIELTTAVRNFFLVWGNNLARYTIGGYHGSEGGNSAATSMGFDGLTSGPGMLAELENATQGQSFNAGSWGAIGITGAKQGLTEGQHYGTILGVFASGGGGTAYWRPWTYTNTHAKGNELPSPVTLSMYLQG